MDYRLDGDGASGIEGSEPDDIDVVASGACLRRVLARAGIPEAAPKPHPQFRSSPYQRIETYGAAPIELMGDLHAQKAAKFMRIVFDHRMELTIGGSTIFIPSIAEQIALFRLFGRDKDLAKAALLEKFAVS